MTIDAIMCTISDVKSRISTLTIEPPLKCIFVLGTTP